MMIRYQYKTVLLTSDRIDKVLEGFDGSSWRLKFVEKNELGLFILIFEREWSP
jgi:hypothetical protein